MSDDKLVKSDSTIETAEAFAKAIGRAIEENDVDTTLALSDELKETAKGERCQRCGHSDSVHWPSGECGLKFDLYGEKCDCKQYVPRTARTGLANIGDVFTAFTTEGKHRAVLNNVYSGYARGMKTFVAFNMTITGSESMPVGSNVTHRMWCDRGIQISIVASALERLGLRLAFASAPDGLRNLGLDIVVVVVQRMTMRTGRPFMTVSMRLPDESDE